MAQRCHPRRDRVTGTGWQGLIVRRGQSGDDKEQMEWLAAYAELPLCKLSPAYPPALPSWAEGWMCAPLGAMPPPSGPSGGDDEVRFRGLLMRARGTIALPRTDGEGLPVSEKEAGDRKVLISVDGAEPRAQR